MNKQKTIRQQNLICILISFFLISLHNRAQAQATDDRGVRSMTISLLNEIENDKPRGAPDWPPETLEEWEIQKEYYYNRYITEVMNWPPESRRKEWGEVPPVFFREGDIDRPTYTMKRMRYMMRPNSWVSANLYIPKNIPEGTKVPAIVFTLGHSKLGKSGYQTHICNLAKQGYVVLAVDAMGMGERSRQGHAWNQYSSLGYNPLMPMWAVGHQYAGLQSFSISRGVDFLVSLPYVDADKIGIAGRSGGGSQTRFAAVADKRFAAAWAEDGVGSYAHRGWGCLCEYPTPPARFCDQYITIATTAPRCAFFIAAGSDDFISKDSDEEVYDKAKPMFELEGVGEKLGMHMWNKGHESPAAVRNRMYGWFAYWLKGEGSPDQSISGSSVNGTTVDEGKVGMPSDDETMVHLSYRDSKTLPPSPTSFETLNDFVLFRNDLRENLTSGTGVFAFQLYMPEKTDISPSGSGSNVYYRSQSTNGRDIVIEANFQRPAGNEKVPVIINASPDTDIDFLVRAGFAVLSVKVRPAPYGGNKTNLFPFYLVGLPVEGQRIYDLMRAVDYLHTRDDVDLEKIGIFANETQGANRALFATALEPRIKVSVLSKGLNSYKLTSADPKEVYTEWDNAYFYPPRILLYADIPQVAAMTSPRPLLIADPVNPRNQPVQAAEVKNDFDLASKAYTIATSSDNFATMNSASNEDYVDWFRSKFEVSLPEVPDEPERGSEVQSAYRMEIFQNVHGLVGVHVRGLRGDRSLEIKNHKGEKVHQQVIKNGNSLIDMTPLRAGRYTFEILANDGLISRTYFNGEYYKPDEYEAWRKLHAVTGSMDEDDDQDGLTNYEEFALQGNPTNVAQHGLIQMHATGSEFGLIHPVRNDGSVRYIVESTTNLLGGSWTTNRLIQTSIAESSAGEYTTVTNQVLIDEHEGQFLRLRIK